MVWGRPLQSLKREKMVVSVGGSSAGGEADRFKRDLEGIFSRPCR